MATKIGGMRRTVSLRMPFHLYLKLIMPNFPQYQANIEKLHKNKVSQESLVAKVCFPLEFNQRTLIIHRLGSVTSKIVCVSTHTRPTPRSSRERNSKSYTASWTRFNSRSVEMSGTTRHPSRLWRKPHGSGKRNGRHFAMWVNPYIYARRKEAETTARSFCVLACTRSRGRADQFYQR